MTITRTIIIVTESYAPKLTILSGFMGWQQDYTQGVALCALDPNATPATPATHRFTSAEGTMPQEIIDRFNALVRGTYLPQIDFNQVQGLTLAEALEAPSNVFVNAKAGSVWSGPQPSVQDTLARDLAAEGLMFRPDGVVI